LDKFYAEDLPLNLGYLEKLVGDEGFAVGS
jgi:hypothetical protein